MKPPRPPAKRTDTSNESSTSDTEESASEESLNEETPNISVLKHPRKLFHNEKEESSDHLEYDDFIPNCSVNSSSEDIFTQSKMAKRNGKFTAPNVPTT